MFVSEAVIVNKDASGIVTLGINRPKFLNALNSEVVGLLRQNIEQIASDQDVRAVVIYSEKNFAAGADVAEMADMNEQEARSFVFSDVFCAIENLRVSTIAAIAGYALGGGMELALCCDFRIAADTARMGFPEITLGIFPGAGGTVRLPHIVGEAVAKELIFLGKRISAEQALQYGLVNKVVPEQDLLPEALSLAATLASRSPTALEGAKAAIMAHRQANAYQEESDLWVQLFQTHDQKEGMHAFLEKRKPTFTGDWRNQL